MFDSQLAPNSFSREPEGLMPSRDDVNQSDAIAPQPMEPMGGRDLVQNYAKEDGRDEAIRDDRVGAGFQDDDTGEDELSRLRRQNQQLKVQLQALTWELQQRDHQNQGHQNQDRAQGDLPDARLAQTEPTPPSDRPTLPLQVIPRIIFDAAPLPMLLLVPQTDLVVRANQAACDLLGYGLAPGLVGVHGRRLSPDLPWQDWWNATPMMPTEVQATMPQPGERFGQDLGQANRPGSPDSTQPAVHPTTLPEGLNKATYRFVKRSGEVFWGQVMLTAIPDDQGAVLYWLMVLQDVTQQYDSEAALANREMRYRLLVENANDVIFIGNFQGYFTYLSPKFTALTGYDVEAFLGQDFLSLCHPDSLQDVLQLLAQLSAAHQPQQSVPLQILCTGGVVRWVVVSVSPICDADNQMVEFQGIVRDVTSDKLQEQALLRMQTALSESEAKYRLLVENANDLIFASTKEGCFTYLSPKFKDITGYDVAEFLGHHNQPLNHPEDDRIAQMIVKRVVTTQQPQIGEPIRIITKTGKIRWVMFNMSPTLDAEGNVIGVQGVARDVTQSKQQEAQILKTQQELVVAREQLQHLLCSSPAVIYSASVAQNHQLTFISDNIQGLLGYSAEECISEAFWVEHVHPDDWPRSLAARAELELLNRCNVEYRVRHRNGEYRWLYDERQAVVDAQGKVIEVVGSLIDVSDRRLMEDKLRSSLEEKEILLKEIHHRVKNNLQLVSSLLSLQANSIQDVAALRPFQDSQNRVHAMAMVHEWLYQSESLAQIDFAGYIKTLAANLQRSYSNMTSTVQIVCEVANVELSLDLSIPCGLIIHELVSNALKYAFPEGRLGTVLIKFCMRSPTVYELLISDDGVGFLPEIDPQDSPSLGLQLVHALTHKIRGTLEIKSSPGAEFKIQFSP